MRRTQLFALGGILCLLVGSLIPSAGINRASAAHGEAMIVNIVQRCQDSPNDCKLPVKYLGERDGCACFTCEYGKSTQRIICTSNESDKNTLMALTRK